MKSRQQGPYLDRDPWGRRSDLVEEPALQGRNYVVIIPALAALAVLCVASFFVARVLLRDSPAVILPGRATESTWLPTAGPGSSVTEPVGTPGEGQILVQPAAGFVGTLISVTGRGWLPGEPVFVFLRSPGDPEGEGYAYAAAVTKDDSSFSAAFTFPNERRWSGQQWAEVIARGSRSEREASARFELVAPTATATLPLPTPMPTQPVTDTPVPTDTPMPTPTPDVIITDWLGEYFGGMSPSGDPVYFRNDVAIDFNWGTGSPDPRIGPDEFSARWTRQMDFGAGYYRFVFSSDDGMRLWLDGSLVVDRWHDGYFLDDSVTLYLPAGQHSLRLEYYEHTGDAMVRLSWTQVPAPTATVTATYTPSPTATSTWTPTATPTRTPLPTATPTNTPTQTPRPTATPTNTATPTATPTNTPVPVQPPVSALPESWQGAYFANPGLEGPPVFVREDPAVSFDWGEGSPGEGLPNDGFSVRWTGEQSVPAGDYSYLVLADDGARFWIDGQLLLDAWVLPPGQIHVVHASLEEGLHSYVVEFYDASGRALVQVSEQVER
ncbi:MAG: PA14 domain-containing protein [Anaerolineae bacterium]|nr:PA14 domain-containing protein [Anaerolineae bacterium]